MIDSRFFDKIGSKDLNEIKEGIQYLIESTNELEIEEIEIIIPVIEPYLQSPIPSLKNISSDAVQRLETIKNSKSNSKIGTSNEPVYIITENQEQELECGICQTPIETGAEVTLCNECQLPFHEECWKENLGCSAYGCPNVNILKAKTETIDSPQMLISAATQAQVPMNYATHQNNKSFLEPETTENQAKSYLSKPSPQSFHSGTTPSIDDIGSNTEMGKNFSGDPITWLEWTSIPVGIFFILLDLFLWGLPSFILCLIIAGYFFTRSKAPENTFVMGLSLGIATGGFIAGLVAGISGIFKLL